MAASPRSAPGSPHPAGGVPLTATHTAFAGVWLSMGETGVPDPLTVDALPLRTSSNKHVHQSLRALGLLSDDGRKPTIPLIHAVRKGLPGLSDVVSGAYPALAAAVAKNDDAAIDRAIDELLPDRPPRSRDRFRTVAVKSIRREDPRAPRQRATPRPSAVRAVPAAQPPQPQPQPPSSSSAAPVAANQIWEKLAGELLVMLQQPERETGMSTREIVDKVEALGDKIAGAS